MTNRMWIFKEKTNLESLKLTYDSFGNKYVKLTVIKQLFLPKLIKKFTSFVIVGFKLLSIKK